MQSESSSEQGDRGNSSNLLLPDINTLESYRPRTHSGPSRNVRHSLANIAQSRKKAFDDMILKRTKHELHANKIAVVGLAFLINICLIISIILT